MRIIHSLGALLTLTHLLAAHASAEPPTGLADSAALRATVYGTPPQDIAPLPALVPLAEIDITLRWARPLPAVLWFDRRLRVWFSAQNKAAPLAIVISGTGDDGNTAKLSLLRATLYGAGYHVLTLPSPTNPGFIAAASSTGVAGDLMQDSRDLYAAAQEIIGKQVLSHVEKLRALRHDIDAGMRSLDAGIGKTPDMSDVLSRARRWHEGK